MMQLAPGIYTFYAGHQHGRNLLTCLYFDGKTMGSPVAFNSPSAPNLNGPPCVFYDQAGAYAGDGQPRIHIFLLTTDDQMWWMSTLDGTSFITHNENVLYEQPTKDRFSALQLADGVHLYYTESSSRRILHAFSRGNWDLQEIDAVSDDIDTATGGVAAVQGAVPYVLFGSAESPLQSALQMFYFLPGTGSNLGNGQLVQHNPGQQLRIQVEGSPAAALLGDNIVVPYKGMGDGSEDAYYATMSLQGTWNYPQRLPDAVTTNSIGCCVYGGRLFCFFQSQSDNSMWAQAYIGGSWLPNAVQVAGSTPAVWWGPASVAVERGGRPY